MKTSLFTALSAGARWWLPSTSKCSSQHGGICKDKREDVPHFKNILFVHEEQSCWVGLQGSSGLRTSTAHSVFSSAFTRPFEGTLGYWAMELFWFFYDSISVLARGLWRIFSSPQLQRGCLRSVRKTEPSLGVRLNKTLKSTRLHFSQGSLRRLRPSRATEPQSATCGGDLTWDSLTAGAENERPQERCPFWDLQENVCVFDLCFCLKCHYLDFMDWQTWLWS